MKIAYFSPFSPDRSGVSDFSEELVFELAKWCEVDLFTCKPIENQQICKEFRVYEIDEIEDDKLRNSYDHLVYQMGNNKRFHGEILEKFMKYPGILEMHDFSLHHLLAESTYAVQDYDEYIRIMEYCHGEDGKKVAIRFLKGEICAPWENQSSRFTVNKHLIDKAKAIIVHSDMAKQMTKGINVEKDVITIPLHTTDLLENYTDYSSKCKSELGWDADMVVFGSFGYATKAKRIESILEALGQIKSECNLNFKYCIVGQVEGLPIDQLIKKYDLKDEVVITGYTEMDEFKLYMGACDICFNLRYPTQGESSASLHRMLGMGKAIFVTNIGTFQEYPDTAVIKIPYDRYEVSELVLSIKELLSDENALQMHRQNAYQYAVENCDIKKNAKRYYQYFEDLHKGEYRDDAIDELLDQMQKLGELDEKKVLQKLKAIGDKGISE